MKILCDECEGMGKVLHGKYKWVTCGSCNGKGLHSKDMVFAEELERAYKKIGDLNARCSKLQDINERLKGDKNFQYYDYKTSGKRIFQIVEADFVRRYNKSGNAYDEGGLYAVRRCKEEWENQSPYAKREDNVLSV